jgi:hypothetical protein
VQNALGFIISESLKFISRFDEIIKLMSAAHMIVFAAAGLIWITQ